MPMHKINMDIMEKERKKSSPSTLQQFARSCIALDLLVIKVSAKIEYSPVFEPLSLQEFRMLRVPYIIFSIISTDFSIDVRYMRNGPHHLLVSVSNAWRDKSSTVHANFSCATFHMFRYCMQTSISAPLWYLHRCEMNQGIDKNKQLTLLSRKC